MEESKYYIKFGAEFDFEGDKYAGIDLSGVEKLSTADLVGARAAYNRQKNLLETPEDDIRYSLIVAQIVCSELPMEWFLQLPAREGRKVHQLIRSFFI